jgi:hypothetical protein
MTRVRSKELYEAEELLEEIASWSNEEVASLPVLYREKVRRYRRLANAGAD